ncbi:hypothetical protein C2G38_2181293 [Gigaspora rosea]|uniref:Uncharacterized protein n=1 Tax=Gigaspora rosea TaxID=44941 RepID=A0A397VD21_9GLOM|nr:hypothetical protein C2G38_2181293 [Gigaspora rosea]
MPLTGPCVIAICKKKLTNWKAVTENLIEKGQTNNTLPSYLQVGDTICLDCYNGIVTNRSAKFQEHARRPETDEPENKEKEPPIYSFDEFRTIMEEKDTRLKNFFDELYLLSNLQSKNKETKIRVKKQLLFICYFLCGIKNKFVNDAKRDLSLYLDSTGASDTTIDTLAKLGIAVTSHSIARCKVNASEEHAEVVDSALARHMEKAIVLNIDDYHSIHTPRMPNTATTSTAAHLATILMNPITNQAAIPQENIHNPLLVDANLIKLNIGNRFMAPYGLLHNQRWGFRTVDDGTRLEELTVHSYDVRLQEKRHSRSMKNVVLIDLQENQLHSMDEYIEAINTVTSSVMLNSFLKELN